MSGEESKDKLRKERNYYRDKVEKLERAYQHAQEFIPQAKTYTPTRRDVIKGVATASLGAAGMYGFSGGASAQTLGSGEIGSQANPALRVYVNRVHFVDLGSEPSSPGSGAMYYNSNF